MFSEELSPALEALVPVFQLRVSDDPLDAGRQVRRERRVRDDVLHAALRVRGDQADAERRGGVQAVRNRDLAWLQAVLVHDVLLRCENEPDRFVVQRGAFFRVAVVVVTDKSLLRGGFLFLVLFGLDVFEEGGGGAGDLFIHY